MIFVSLIAFGFLAQRHLASGELVSLLSGFAPIIGSFGLLVFVALLLSFLIYSAERTFCTDDDNAIPEARKKHIWPIVRSCSSDLLTNYISLKEHSPPVVSLSLM
jgi:hypothetical protein